MRIMLLLERELAGFKFLDGLQAHLKGVREPRQALRHALRDICEFFQPTHGCIATVQAGWLEADLLFTLPKDGNWNLDLLVLHSKCARSCSARHADCAGATARRRVGRDCAQSPGTFLTIGTRADSWPVPLWRYRRPFIASTADRMLGVRD